MWSNQNVQISLGVYLTIKIVYGSKIKPKFCNVSTRQGGSFMAYLDCGIGWLWSHLIQKPNLPICLDWGATPTRPASSCPRSSSFSGNQLVLPKTSGRGRPEWSRSRRVGTSNQTRCNISEFNYYFHFLHFILALF